MIKLDVCCGQYKHPGHIGLDIRDVEGVDIVHDVCVFPWPVDSDSCSHACMMLAWSCIEPKYRIQLMNEFWRVLSADGILHIVDQYYKGERAHHDPTCYSCPNEWTFLYFSPAHVKYKVYEPKPWKISSYSYDPDTVLSVMMTPIKEVIV